MDDQPNTAEPMATEKAAATPSEAKREVLTECVRRMKAGGLTGKLRDDAAGHFMAGVWATVKALGLEDEIALDSANPGYLGVLEALAA